MSELVYVKRCTNCWHLLRNDGTEQEPKWVCNNPSCVCYVPPADSEDSEDAEEE